MTCNRVSPLLAVLVLGWAAASAAREKQSLSPPVLLPDGQEFKTWETPLSFSRTYYVDQAHPKASDENLGTEDLPWKTISRAAEGLQPGERVVIAAGVYRECVRPARGGSGPERVISYEAATGFRPSAAATGVIVSGSQPVTTPWMPSSRQGIAGPPGLWMTRFPRDLFPAENPFLERNLTDAEIDKGMPWAVSTKGKAPNLLRRGLLFQDDRRLKQTAAYDELSAMAGTYWVEDDGLTVHCHPLDGADLNRARMEVTVAGMIFAPEAFGLGYIRVKGLMIEHTGNRFPRPQQGALSTQRGHHWIIEDCTIRECSGIGIDIGDQFALDGPKLAEDGQHIVRRNAISECGIGGLEGLGIHDTLIEDNFIARCGWQQAQYIWETGGIKVHLTQGVLIRRNLIRDTIDAPGIWMDWQNKNSRCCQNVILNARTVNGGIFMEASQVPNLVDHNFVWGTHGNGIYQHDCDELIVAHNFIAGSSDAGIRMQVCEGRIVGDRVSTAKRNQILNNVLVDNDRPLAISDPENTCDGNVFGPSRALFDIEQWRADHGWDKNSTAAEAQASFNPEALELTWSVKPAIPDRPRLTAMTHDFFGQPIPADHRPPGPFGTIPPSAASIRLGPQDSPLTP